MNCTAHLCDRIDASSRRSLLQHSRPSAGVAPYGEAGHSTVLKQPRTGINYAADCGCRHRSWGIFKNRKGTLSGIVVSFLPKIFFLVVMFTVCVLLIGMFISEGLQVKDVQAEVLIGGLIYGKGGLGHVDPVTGRGYPGIIDFNQMESRSLEDGLFYPSNNLIAARISVFRYDKSSMLRQYYYNKEWWDNWSPLIKRALPGRGGVTMYSRALPTIYRDGSGEDKLGYVVFEVVQPKS